jgi:predicted GIY-YIG superfamily endonuclease
MRAAAMVKADAVVHTYYVYILTNVPRTVMYVGVTNDIERRLSEHRSGLGGVFTKRYRVHTLVYLEEFQRVEDAIATEKRIKGWSRAKKNALIEQSNPSWRDLALSDCTQDPSLRSG